MHNPRTVHLNSSNKYVFMMKSLGSQRNLSAMSDSRQSASVSPDIQQRNTTGYHLDMDRRGSVGQVKMKIKTPLLRESGNDEKFITQRNRPSHGERTRSTLHNQSSFSNRTPFHMFSNTNTPIQTQTPKQYFQDQKHE